MKNRQSVPTRTQQSTDVSSRDEIRQLFRESDEAVREFFEEFDTPPFSTTRRQPRRKVDGGCSPQAPE